jgi:lipid II:glycine glycyltransferase (peptidoglycan interpeptide bridge formation enzyme)
MDENKIIYNMLCEKEFSIPIFSQAWWLDAVAGEKNWNIVMVKSNNEILATLPYYRKNLYGFTILTQPVLTQNLGPWIKTSEVKYNKMLSQQKKLMNALIVQLPKYDYFAQNWHYSQTNWLPFYWHGFEASTLYTYVIEDLSDIDFIWGSLKENIRWEVRKAQNKIGISVRSDLPVDDFISLNQLTFRRQRKLMPYSISFIKTLIEKARQRNQCKWFIGQDKLKKNHAGVLIVWDDESAYYLMGGGDPELRNSGATSLCIWEAIKFASTVTKKFDFEGSMIEPIESFFRGFGAVQKPYFRLTHKPSKILNTLFSLKKIIKDLVN